MVAEHGAVAAGEHRRHLVPAGPDRPVAHGIHPAVKGVEATGAQPGLDRAPAHPGRQQLRPANDPMLLRGDSGDQPIRGGGWDGSAPYTVVNSSHPPSLTLHAARITTPQCQKFVDRGPRLTAAPAASFS